MNLGKKIKLLMSIVLFAQSSYASSGFVGTISAIPPDIQKLMVGRSWHPGCPVGFNQLAYLRLSYWGFDDRPHLGELIVYRPIAENTVDVFRNLYRIKFPIESMKLPERLPKGVSNSKVDNTSAFYCRLSEQNTAEYSKHSYGIAVDINDRYNPSIIAGGKVDPEDGRKYLDRSLHHKGMIKKNDQAFMIFAHHCWVWGGFYTEVDYQHFGKIITKHYRANRCEYNLPDQQLAGFDD